MARINRFGLEVFGHYYSAYQGFVAENEDPKGMQRLQVLVPGIMGMEGPPLWAYRKGISPRVQDLPEVGDMVWVEFLNGRLTSPTWTHYYPLKADIIPEFKHPKCYGFKSPGGYLVLIDELEKTLVIKTPEGLYRTITEDSIIDKADKIFLTDPEATQKVPKGQEMDSDIKDALTEIKGVLEKIMQFATTQAAAAGTAPLTPLATGYSTLITDVTSTIGNLAPIIEKFGDDSHLSEKVKLT